MHVSHTIKQHCFICQNSKKCFNTKEYIIKFRKHGNSFGDNNTDKALKETLVIKKYLANENQAFTSAI